MNSVGKNVPSATPELEQLVGFRGRLDEGRGAQRARHLLGDAPAGADLEAGEVLDLGDRKLRIEHLSGAVREHTEQLDALVLSRRVEILPVDARVGDRVDRGSCAAARQLGQRHQHVAGRRVACRDVGNVDQAILDRVKGAWRRRRMLRQHLQLDPSIGGLLDLLTPHRQHVLGQWVGRRYPARHGELGLGSGGCRRAGECSGNKHGRAGARDGKAMHLGGSSPKDPQHPIRPSGLTKRQDVFAAPAIVHHPSGLDRGCGDRAKQLEPAVTLRVSRVSGPSVRGGSSTSTGSIPSSG